MLSVSSLLLLRQRKMVLVTSFQLPRQNKKCIGSTLTVTEGAAAMEADATEAAATGSCRGAANKGGAAATGNTATGGAATGATATPQQPWEQQPRCSIATGAAAAGAV